MYLLLNNSKQPIIVFDKKLDVFRDRILFPKKLEKVNQLLSKEDLPKAKK